jgi:O-antigen/teichoic acid export membrane protein
VRTLVLGLRFLSELALLAGAAVAGWRLGDGGVAGALLAAVGAVGVAAVWARWIAPKAHRRMADPKRLAAELVLFGAAGLALVVVNATVAGVVVAGAGCALALALRGVGGDGPAGVE